MKATVQCVICEDPQKERRAQQGKELRLFARHEPTGRVGNIIDADKVPDESRAIGAEIRLYVQILNRQQLQFMYEPPPPSKPKQGGHKHGGFRR